MSTRLFFKSLVLGIFTLGCLGSLTAANYIPRFDEQVKPIPVSNTTIEFYSGPSTYYYGRPYPYYYRPSYYCGYASPFYPYYPYYPANGMYWW